MTVARVEVCVAQVEVCVARVEVGFERVELTVEWLNLSFARRLSGVSRLYFIDFAVFDFGVEPLVVAVAD